MTPSRSPSTPAACSALLLLLTFLCGACGGPQLQLVLTKADDLQGSPAFVRFEVQQLDEQTPDRLGPFPLQTVPANELGKVPPGKRFFIDVIGCQTSKLEECTDPVSFIARGCTPIITLERDADTRTETVTMHSASVGAQSCPPQ